MLVISHRRTVAALGAAVIGAGTALLSAGREWATVRVSRPAPLADLAVHVTGRTEHPALPVLGLAALAGVVAVLATRGVLRRIIAVLLASCGAGIVALAFTGGRLTPAHARGLVIELRVGAVVDATARVHVQAHPLWPWLTAFGGVVVVVGAAVQAASRSLPGGLGRRYEAPKSPAETPPAELTMWSSLDRGEDPTIRTQS